MQPCFICKSMAWCEHRETAIHSKTEQTGKLTEYQPDIGVFSTDAVLLKALKRRANAAVRQAIKKGRLKRPLNCPTCAASGMVHAHHYDYRKPLEVRWVCATCHGKIHGLLNSEQKTMLESGIPVETVLGLPVLQKPSWIH